MATLIIFGGLVFPSTMQQEAAAAGTRQAGLAIAGGFNWLAFSYALWESFVVVGRVYWPAGALPSALESSREVGEKLGRHCLHRVPDPSPGACRFCLCLPRGNAVSSAQICHRG